MKRNPVKFFEYLQRTCEHRREKTCLFKKKNEDACNIEKCPMMPRTENKSLLNPACELLRELNLDFIHMQRTGTSARDTLKTNKGFHDLLIFLDEHVLAIELKTGKNDLRKDQIEKHESFKNKTYAISKKVDTLGDFFCELVSATSKREDTLIEKNKIKIKKWLDKYGIDYK